MSNEKKESVRVKQAMAFDLSLIPIGTSGKNLCMTLSTDALKKLLEGHIYPLEFDIVGGAKDEKMKINLMLNTTFEKKFTQYSAILDKAKENVAKVEQNNREATDLGKDIGNEKLVDVSKN